MADSGTPTLKEIAARLDIVERRSIRLEISSYVKYGILLALVVACAWFGAARLAEASRTHKAICVFRSDLQRRAAQSRDLLEHNAQLIKALGLTAPQVRQTLANQDRTVRSLRSLRCK